MIRNAISRRGAGNRPSPEGEAVSAPAPFFQTVKEMAAALGRSEDYVSDMKKGGFELPATLDDAVDWLKKHGPPTKFRGQTATKYSLYRPKKG